MNNTDRAAFEDWVRMNFTEYDFSRYPQAISIYGNEYVMNKINDMWLGWCGATGQDPKQP